jgi:hypothetical protein
MWRYLPQCGAICHNVAPGEAPIARSAAIGAASTDSEAGKVPVLGRVEGEYDVIRRNAGRD